MASKRAKPDLHGVCPVRIDISIYINLRSPFPVCLLRTSLTLCFPECWYILTTPGFCLLLNGQFTSVTNKCPKRQNLSVWSSLYVVIAAHTKIIGKD